MGLFRPVFGPSFGGGRNCENRDCAGARDPVRSPFRAPILVRICMGTTSLPLRRVHIPRLGRYGRAGGDTITIFVIASERDVWVFCPFGLSIRYVIIFEIHSSRPDAFTSLVSGEADTLGGPQSQFLRLCQNMASSRFALSGS